MRRHFYGEKYRLSKLSDVERVAILALIDKGEPPVDIAKRFRVGVSLIYKIRSGKEWVKFRQQQSQKRKQMFDPPSGHRYGFPKAVPDDVKTEEDYRKWLLESGYPEKDVDFALENGRGWEE